MSDGGYSRIEKDFLGNERMVHYDAAGNMLGASDVIREEDGTIRISNDPISPEPAATAPFVEVLVPPTKVADPEPPVVDRFANKGMPVSQVVTYSIGAFIATLLLTLGALSYFRSNGEQRVRSIDNAPIQRPQTNFTQPESQPMQENFPSDPRPRNDEQPAEAPPFDNTAPDSNMDDNRPRIDTPDQNSVEPSRNSDPKPPKKGPDDPIDLRGDDGGKKDPPTKGDPGDPLRGDDIH